jgi:hypothetical protein
MAKILGYSIMVIGFLLFISSFTVVQIEMNLAFLIGYSIPFLIIIGVGYAIVHSSREKKRTA